MLQEKYLEKIIPFEGDHSALGTKVVEAYKKSTVGLYEMPSEISIGIGVEATVTVCDRSVNISCNGECYQIEVHNDLSESIDKGFKSIGIKGWRAYGIAKFGLARVNFNLELGAEDQELIRAFVPRMEVRICDTGSIMIRALSMSELENVTKQLQLLITEASKDSDKIEVVDNHNMLFSQKDYYEEIVSKGIEEIKEKKYKKVILSRKMDIPFRIDMIKSYLYGRRINTPSRSYLYMFDDIEVVGFSPETVTEVNCNGDVSTLPLAGTRALTDDATLNEKLRQELYSDTKEIAEHCLSVKLAFDELTKICFERSVYCNEFMEIMERGTVQHLGSRVSGKLAHGINSWHAFNTLFPAITASGIPKRESIEAIGRLEKDPRGIYSGSVFTYDESGQLDAALVL